MDTKKFAATNGRPKEWFKEQREKLQADNARRDEQLPKKQVTIRPVDVD